MLAHIHIMKTAGQTICDILRQSFPGRHCDLRVRGIATAADLRFAAKLYPRLEGIGGHCVRSFTDLQDAVSRPIRYFTFVRDPVMRTISHYQFMVQKNGLTQDFQTWLRTTPQNYQCQFLANVPSADAAVEQLETRIGLVGLVERFNESLVLLRRWSGDPQLNIRYRPRNIAKDNRIKKDILSDPSKLDAIKQHSREDVKLFRHVKEILFPRQIERYGSQFAHDATGFESSLPAPRAKSLKLTVACAKRNLLYKPYVRYGRNRGKAFFT